VGSKAFGGSNRRLKEKTAESRWFTTTGQAPFGRAKAAYWKNQTRLTFDVILPLWTHCGPHRTQIGTIAMIIPHQMLSPEALQGVIEAFVTREGTDYGTQDVSLATKVLQVRQQLDAGTAVLVYDEDTESCTIQPTQQLPDHIL
jgi:uncharacterized protein YheU (UPF0270 family)